MFTFKLKNNFLKVDLSHSNFSKNNCATNEVKQFAKNFFDGKKINFTENKNVLHWLLRKQSILNNFTDNFDDVIPSIGEEESILKELKKMKDFTEKFQRGELKGFNGKKIKTIINIGIGGSDLGPRMICTALKHLSLYDVRFISNVDPTAILNTVDLNRLDETLFIIVSKSFTTEETLLNTHSILQLYKDQYAETDFKNNFAAITANKKEAKIFGLTEIFTMGDSVGGRFSLWSTVGLSIALKIGFNNFILLLQGASLIDQYFYKSIESEECNIFYQYAYGEIELMKENYSKTIIPYVENLSSYYKYIQQLEMESNGKERSNMIIWGGIGTDAQHSFFQMIHQGNKKIFTEFIVALKSFNKYEDTGIFKKAVKNEVVKNILEKNHKVLLANAIAQSKALYYGDGTENFIGKKPSSVLIIDELNPLTLGALIALNEHKVLIQGKLLNINSFDQPGVQLGKKLAKDILKKLNSDEKSESDDLSKNLIDLAKFFY